MNLDFLFSWYHPELIGVYVFMGFLICLPILAIWIDKANKRYEEQKLDQVPNGNEFTIIEDSGNESQ